VRRVVVASKNPVKVQTSLEAFQMFFPDEEFEVEGLSVSSNVSKQPLSDEETLRGAINRVDAVFHHVQNADFWVGIEGGVEEKGGEMEAFAWVVVRSRTTVGKGKTATFLLPKPVIKLIREGKELGEADDIIFHTTNSKQGTGAVGLLTGNVINRTELYRSAAILALIPFKNTDLY